MELFITKCYTDCLKTQLNLTKGKAFYFHSYIIQKLSLRFSYLYFTNIRLVLPKSINLCHAQFIE